MKNREIILNTDSCDILKKINSDILDDAGCIIDCLSGKEEKDRRCIKYDICYKCIEDWMNEENITGGSFVK